MRLQKLKFGAPPSKGRSRPWFEIILCIVIVSWMLPGCSLLTKRSPVSPVGPDPIVVAACPELSPLFDKSMGALTLKLAEVGGTYNECRLAALAGAGAGVGTKK